MDIVELIPESAQKILDVGCSNGALGNYLRAMNPKCIVDGVEIDEIFCTEAKKKLNHVVNANLNKKQLKELLPDKKFDCIIFADILEHLLAPDEKLMDAFNFLNDGGTVIISMPNIRHISSLFSIFILGTFPRKKRGIFDSTHLRWFTISDANNMIESHGFAIQKTTYNLRIGDKGDSFLNKVTRKLLTPIAAFYPVREFLTYQYSIRATKPSETHPMS